ncbi:tripartite motif-containing protein 65 [Notechis scutatus]|uniref:Tripartite motif-containing protein 65 n=1 Tax=Notechis scutatus TaxID=8663 RepID=A0A6J1TY79_9SAUR|nr:tripartite motif-containing protein 65 [Notechis scutatus]
MDSSGSQKLEEKLTCCICLEMFTIPVTVPCGHSFCEKCINSHWDKEEQGQKICTCPECRNSFPERPKLSKTVQLENLVELLKLEEFPPGVSEGEMRKAAGSRARLCPSHGRPLELYCVTEKCCICCVCTVRSCQKHQRALFEERRKAQESSGIIIFYFLQEQHLLSPSSKLEVPPVIQLDLDKNANTVTKFFTEFYKLLEALPSNLLNPQMGGRKIRFEPKVFVERMPGPCLSENELRTKLLKDQQNLTFDPVTANKYLQISNNNQKATHPQFFQKPKPNDSQRFEPWQVMCTQNFSQGSHYWEVELSNHSVIVGVACETFTRSKQAHQKFTIGLDKLSWGLHIQEHNYVAWYNDKSTKIKEPLCKFIGVLLDCDQGTISFYSIDNNMKCLHVFHAIFMEPLVPIFWLCEGTAVTLCQRPPSQIITDERTPDLQV